MSYFYFISLIRELKSLSKEQWEVRLRRQEDAASELERILEDNIFMLKKALAREYGALHREEQGEVSLCRKHGQVQVQRRRGYVDERLLFCINAILRVSLLLP